jgi:hypothetical protein
VGVGTSVQVWIPFHPQTSDHAPLHSGPGVPNRTQN